MILTTNFTLEELIASTEAKKHKINNEPSPSIIWNLQELCNTILQPLRDAWGSGIRVNSGFRCEKLNAIVKGSKTSVHVKGWAADIYPVNGRFDDFVKFVVAWFSQTNTGFDQILIESNSAGKRWLHIGLYNNSHKQRKQIKNIYVA